MSKTIKSLVLIDDEVDILNAYESFFSRRGFETKTFLDGAKGCSYIIETKPDLAFIDITLEHMNGLEIIHKLKETNCPTKLYILSGHMDEETRSKVEDTGVVFLPKTQYMLPDLLKIASDALGIKGDVEPSQESSPKVNVSTEKFQDYCHDLRNCLKRGDVQADLIMQDAKDNMLDDLSKEKLVELMLNFAKTVRSASSDGYDLLDSLRKYYK